MSLNVLETVLVSGATTLAMGFFSSIASFVVNRYAPKIAERIEKIFKKRLDK